MKKKEMNIKLPLMKDHRHIDIVISTCNKCRYFDTIKCSKCLFEFQNGYNCNGDLHVFSYGSRFKPRKNKEF